MTTTKRTISKSWQKIKLGDICHIAWGNTSITKKSYVSTGYVAYSASGPDGFLSSFGHDETAIVLSAIGARCGKCFLATEKWTAIKNTIVIQPKDNSIVDINFLFHYINREEIWPTDGMAQPFITMGGAQSVLIPLPPIDEQKSIALHLDEQMHHIEEARQAAEESLSAAWELPSAYLSSVFDASDGHRWKWEKLDDVCELLPAKAIKTIGNTSVTTITSACLTENGFSPDGLKSARMDENDAKVALVKKDEILIARSNTPELVGRVSIYLGDPPNVVASDLTIRIWAKPSCYPPFLNAYLSYLYLSGYWKERAGGASGTMKKITRSQLLDIKVPVPDIDTQKKIVEEMQEKMSHFKQLEQSLESQLAEINELPSALLRQAFAGQL